MMNPYVLTVPERVISGAGCISKLPELLKELDKKKVALFADMGALKSGAIDATIETLKASCESFTLVNNVPPEPEDRQVREIFGQVKDCGAAAIVAIGGGSVMDTSKIISVMMTNPGYYDDLTDQSKIVNRGAPLLVAPTSAGTGSEATPNAIVLIPEKKLKVGVVHMPSLSTTYHMFSAKEFARMPKGSYLINCARGSVVDETALYEALESGQLAGAGLDVMEHEPFDVGNPLLQLSNVIFTPHVAGVTAQASERTHALVVDSTLSLLKGKAVSNLANPDVLKHPRWTEVL